MYPRTLSYPFSLYQRARPGGRCGRGWWVGKKKSVNKQLLFTRLREEERRGGGGNGRGGLGRLEPFSYL